LNAGPRLATPPERRNASLLAGPERRLLNLLVRRIPRGVTPDNLTTIGVAGAFATGAGFALGPYGTGWLWLALIGLVVHWFGDSLDGTLARYRAIERSRYGLMLDQSVDTLSNLAIAVGIGLSPWARLDLALLVLAAYHMLTIGGLLRTIVDGEFHIDVAGFGPTEMRIGIAAIGAGIMAFGAPPIAGLPLALTWCDLLLAVLFPVLLALFCVETAGSLRRLSGEPLAERPDRYDPVDEPGPPVSAFFNGRDQALVEGLSSRRDRKQDKIGT
jgi:archaetidylinositol phosphate synthase